MSIRQKTFAALAATLAVSVSAVALLSGAFVLRAAEMIDADDAMRATVRARRAVLQDMDELARFTRDYAAWDDTYAYAVNRNRAYTDDNYVDDTFVTNRVNFVVITDANDATLFAKGFDPGQGAAGPVPIEIPPIVTAGGLSRQARSASSAVRGIWFLNGGPMMVAAHPILTSGLKGPARGAFVAGRALDKAELDRLRKVTDVNMTMLPWTDPRVSAETRGALRDAGGEQALIRDASASKKEGFSPFPNALGEPSAVLQTNVPRERYRSARDRLAALVLLLLAPGLVTGLVFAQVMERSVLGRLTKLHEFARGVQKRRELSARLEMPGDDEIAGLGAAFNAMMQTLEDDAIEHRRADEALRASEERHRRYLESAPDAIFVVDQNGICVAANPAASRLTGYPESEIVGAQVARASDPEFAAVARRAVAALRDTGRYSGEATFRRKDGALIVIEIDAAKDAVGNYIAFGKDITARKQAERERARLEEELRQATKMEAVGRLAGGVAHDFNNLLTGMIGHVEMATGQLPEEHPARTDLAEIWKAAERAASLTSQLLAFGRRQPIEPRVVDLNELIAESTRMLKRLIGEDIDLLFNPGPDAGCVKVDPHQIEQVLMNLAANARDAMPNGGVLSISLGGRTVDDDAARGRSDCAPGEYIVLTVADDGVGMTPEVLERLFEPFFTTKNLGRGAGLGLSIVFGVVQQNNGFIEVESTPQSGTVFRIHLPRVAEAPTPVLPSAAQPSPRGHETVLLVEDEDMVRHLARKVLERQGYQVVEAESGAEALRLFDEHEAAIGLLLTDVVMPQMNGRELYVALRGRRPALKALFMSGYTEDVIARHGVIDPGTHFIQKPFTIDQLARKVRETLDS